MRNLKKPRRTVRYVNWGANHPVVRYFPTEPGARAFYKRLFKRATPPMEQSVGREIIAVSLEALEIRKVVKAKGSWAVELRLKGGPRLRITCGDDSFTNYAAFRKALLLQTGYGLPERRITRHAWRVLFRNATNGEVR